MERLTVGTHQGHCITQAGASLLQAKKILPPNCLTTRSHAIGNVVKKRENYTTSGQHQGPNNSPSCFLVSETELNCALCGGCGPSSPHLRPGDIFFFLKMASPVLFLENTKTEAYLLFSALLGCKSFKTRRDVSSKKWACPENGL